MERAPLQRRPFHLDFYKQSRYAVCMHRPRFLVISVSATIFMVMLAGCGSSSSGTSVDQQGAAQKAVDTLLAKKANAICARGARKREAKLAKAKGKPPANDVAELERLVIVAFVPSLEETMAELSKLQGSAESNARIAEIVGAYQTGIRTRKAHPRNALKEAAFTRADQLAWSFGWTQCAQIG
jgi:hypothetical protein